MLKDNINEQYVKEMLHLYEECYREAYKDGQDDLKEELDIEEIQAED